jgi:hypothetical protein
VSLGVEVEEHDDGSMQNMYDLRILYLDRTPGAVEVTAAADQQSVKLGKLVYDGKRWIVPGIVGGWSVGLRPRARMKRLKVELPAPLQSLESQGVRGARPEMWWEEGPHDEALRDLGITHLFQSEATDYAGSVYPMVEQPTDTTGGTSPTDGRSLLNWLVEWLTRPDKADNLAKLNASGADERHLFLVLPDADAPFGVVDLLRDDSPLRCHVGMAGRGRRHASRFPIPTGA